MATQMPSKCKIIYTDHSTVLYLASSENVQAVRFMLAGTMN